MKEIKSIAGVDYHRSHLERAMTYWLSAQGIFTTVQTAERSISRVAFKTEKHAATRRVGVSLTCDKTDTSHRL